MPRAKFAKKPDWMPVSVRVSPEMRIKLKEKHPNDGEISKVLYALIDKYLRGQILGIKIQS